MKIENFKKLPPEKLALFPLLNVLAFLVISGTNGYSQKADLALSNKVVGQILDSLTQSPVPLATVEVKSSVAAHNMITAANEKGHFSITVYGTSHYKITISSLGYQTKAISLDAKQLTGDSNGIKILLHPEAKSLDEVTVKSQKLLFEDAGDKYIYHAGRDLSNSGGNAIDVLKKAPLLSVDPVGNVKMRGSSSIRILINGRHSNLLSRNLSEALKQIPARSIKAIEVIASPGAKYDGEGAGGIVNIITKRDVKGVEASVEFALGTLNRSITPTIGIGRKRIAISTALNLYQYRAVSRVRRARESDAYVLTQDVRKDNLATGLSGNFSIDFAPDTLNLLSFSTIIWGGNSPDDHDQEVVLNNRMGELVQAYDRAVDYRNLYGNSEFNLGWTRTGLKGNRELVVLTQFSQTPDNYDYTVRQSLHRNPYYYERSDNSTRNNEYTIQIDYSGDVSNKIFRDKNKLRYEIGAKSIIRTIDSQYAIESSDTGLPSEYTKIPDRSGTFDYFQKVLAGYTSFQYVSKNELKVSGGIRFESTYFEGLANSNLANFKNRYHNFLPSINLSKLVLKRHTFKFSYNHRIGRPLVFYLNPYQNISDEKNISTGNPLLRPELTAHINLGYSGYTDNGLTFSTFYFHRKSRNSIDFFAIKSDSGRVITQPLNMASNVADGIYFFSGFQSKKGINLSLGIDLMRVNFKGPNAVSNSGWISSYNVIAGYRISDSFSVQGNAYLSTGDITLQERSSKWYFYSLSCKKTMIKKKLDLTISLNSPFTAYNKITSVQTTQAFQTNTLLMMKNRYIRATIFYTISKGSERKVKRSTKVSNEDGKRGK